MNQLELVTPDTAIGSPRPLRSLRTSAAYRLSFDRSLTTSVRPPAKVTGCQSALTCGLSNLGVVINGLVDERQDVGRRVGRPGSALGSGGDQVSESV
jgi:hypothetical protein